MATISKQGRVDRLKYIADDANPAFAVGAVVVPIGIYVLAVAIDSLQLLFYTHVASGAIWFALAVVFPALLGPTLGGLSPEAAGEFTSKFTSKVTFFMFGIPTATVLSGTTLAGEFGLLGVGNLWVNTALVLGWGLWLFGLLVVMPTHLTVYWESHSETPDHALLERLERRIMVVGLVDAVGLLIVIGVMTTLRLGPPL